MQRETTEQLQARMNAAERLVPAGWFIRHVRTGGEYLVRGHSLRVGDLALMVNYSPRFGPVIVFSRTVDDIRAKFVLAGGNPWPEPSEET
jgi:biotin carboxylase